jgi:hypothetical protein
MADNNPIDNNPADNNTVHNNVTGSNMPGSNMFSSSMPGSDVYFASLGITVDPDLQGSIFGSEMDDTSFDNINSTIPSSFNSFLALMERFAANEEMPPATTTPPVSSADSATTATNPTSNADPHQTPEK